MTEWHVRYGGRGVMIYWHVERHSTCIYSQLKTPSSSEVAAMIEGVLRHCTEMDVQKAYVDSHGQSDVAFAFCHLLGFHLLPRLKRIHVQRALWQVTPTPGWGFSHGLRAGHPEYRYYLTNVNTQSAVRLSFDTRRPVLATTP
jgi:hypothetical protein